MEKEKQECHVIATPSLFQAYGERTLPVAAQELIKGHLDGCPTCHDLWNRYRWDRAKSSPGYQEWLAYLEEQREPLHEYFDSSRALIAEWQTQHPQTKEERERFFRSTPHYLSNLLIWHESGHRPPYVAKALPWLRQLHARVICDVGCGIGSDGLRFLEAGYRVLFCEFDNPASRFLRWRLRLRQHHARNPPPHRTPQSMSGGSAAHQECRCGPDWGRAVPPSAGPCRSRDSRTHRQPAAATGAAARCGFRRSGCATRQAPVRRRGGIRRDSRPENG